MVWTLEYDVWTWLPRLPMTCKELTSVIAVPRGAEGRKGPRQGRLPKCKDGFVEPKRAQEGSFELQEHRGFFGGDRATTSPTAKPWGSVAPVCGSRDLARHKKACIDRTVSSAPCQL